jgi:anti-sigma regulatory factor (Ser/Thr protein kinase)
MTVTMPGNQTIIIQNASDIIAARLAVREMARHSGMNLSDQSRISLATSSLANAMGLGQEGTAKGQITIECLENGDRRGVKVVCIRNDCDEYVPPETYFRSERWMVDEFNMKVLPSNTVEITMIKWITQ